jgi:hypothetical protein
VVKFHGSQGNVAFQGWRDSKQNNPPREGAMLGDALHPETAQHGAVEQFFDIGSIIER